MQSLGTKKITQPLGEKKCPKNSILVTNKLQEIGTGHLGLVPNINIPNLKKVDKPKRGGGQTK